MSAFFLAHISVKHPEKWERYTTSARQTIREAGGQVRAMQKHPQVLANSLDFPSELVALIEFPSLKSCLAWYESTPYQNLIPTRDEAADVAFIALQEVEK